MKKKIILKTRLDDSIYRSAGGGVEREFQSWNLGPRNLVDAFHAIKDHRKASIRNFGNIGAGRSWLEIDGVRFSERNTMFFLSSANVALLIAHRMCAAAEAGTLELYLEESDVRAAEDEIADAA